MATQLQAQRRLARQLQAQLAVQRIGNVSIMVSVTTLPTSCTADTAVLTRTGTHLAAQRTCALTT